MSTPLTMLLLLALACGQESTPHAQSGVIADAVTIPSTTFTPRHYDIRPDQLPAPYATNSVGNPPNVVPQPPGATLQMPPGFAISTFATNLGGPRTMLVAANGDIIVAEMDAGRVSILRDDNHDGVSDQRFTFVSGLDQPFGLAIHDNYLYVGSNGSVVRYDYVAGQTAKSGAGTLVTSVPKDGHATRGVLFNPAGTKMYVSIGSYSNVDVESDPMRAAIVEFNPDGSGKRVFASGLRNPVGMAWEPTTGALWTVVNERDGLGDDLVPDYATEVKDGAFYGWPYAYIGQHEEPRLAGENPQKVAQTIVPSLLLQAHSAALGIAFYGGTMFPADYRGDAFVALHGSWNRSKRTGYKIVRIAMKNGQPAGGYDDFITGWSPSETSRDVWGRPVGLLVLPDGSMLISDDGANKIWRVTYSAPTAGARRRAVGH